MTIKIVTYANKSDGLFEELVNNRFGVQVEVLGWGTKWNGFKDKLIGVRNYVESQPDSDIIVFLDGFDTKIEKPLDGLQEMFESFDCGILLSKDPDLFKFIGGVFKKCRLKSVANAGMYMGYAWHLKQILPETLKLNCKDDQENFNTLCEKYDFIQVDEDEVIFKNHPPVGKQVSTDAMFVSFPGTLSVNRVLRSFKEYPQFIKGRIVLVHLFLMFISPRKYRCIPAMSMSVFLILYLLHADKSCYN